jgi:hypothetical protein
MEFLTIFFSGLLGLISPVGLVLDQTAENTIRSQFAKVEHLQVRIDNVPTYQLLQGKVERLRIAGRGMQFQGQDVRIALLELETDAIELDIGTFKRLPRLKKPLQAGVRFVLN